MVATGVVHSDPEYYPDPDKFEIERHLAPRLEFRKKGAFVPFGIGPHTCLGRAWAIVQIATTLAAMLHYAEFEPDRQRKGKGIKITNYPSLRPHPRTVLRVARLREN